MVVETGLGAALFQNVDPRVALRFDASRIEPDLDGVFLSNKKSASLATIAARSETDLHITGSARATNALLTNKPMQMQLPIESNAARTFDKSGGTVLSMSNRTRVNITTSRTVLAINGIVIDSMSGQASVALDTIFEQGHAAIPVNYSNFGELSAVIEMANVQLVDADTGVAFDSVRFEDDADTNEAVKQSAKVLESVFLQGQATRSTVVYQPAPPLSKAVMRVPYGHDGCGYDLSCAAVERPPSLERSAFESIASAAIGLETGFNPDETARFVRECARPGFAASKWSGAVANAMSTFVSAICPYRVDGRVVLMPDGLQMVASESWKAEASRTMFFTGDDCDGSGAHCTAMLYAAKRIAADPDLAAKYPITAAFANAMSLHAVGIAILAANAGHAGDAGKKGVQNVAGHAIAMALPRSMVLNSLVIGLKSAAQASGADTGARISELRDVWASAMFTEAELGAMSPEDAARLRSVDTLSTLHEGARFGEMEALAIEGTSPVAPSLLFSKSAQDRLERRNTARNDKKMSKMLGPTIARTITQLDVTASNTDQGHAFYKDFVEFLLPPSSELFQSQALRDHGLATAQLVFAQPHDVKTAGASPKDVATATFAMVPLWKVSSDGARTMDVALEEVAANTMPMRAGPTVLDASGASAYRSTVERLRTLHENKSLRYGETAHSPRSQHIFAIGSLVHNPHAVDAFCAKIERMGDAVAAHVDLQSMPGCLVDPTGEDLGVFVVVNLEQLEA